MNQENLKFLQDRLFYLGTEKRLHADLEKKMAEGKPEFKLFFSNNYDKDKLEAALHFRKSDNSDMYFLNRYDAILQKPAEESKKQTFYLDHGKGVTMKEAYNLLDGRTVNKDLKNKEEIPYNAWLKLDFSNKDEKGNHKVVQYHKNYGYDLQSELLKLPLPQMTAEESKQFVASLERGNLQQVKFDVPVNSVTHTLAANPQFKTIDIFDEKGRPLSRSEINDLHLLTAEKKNVLDKAFSNPTMNSKAPEKTIVREQSVGTENSKEKEEKTKIESVSKSENNQLKEQKPEQKKTAKETKKERVASLLPKKQSSHKKGLSI